MATQLQSSFDAPVMFVGRDPEIEPVVVRDDPPEGLSRRKRRALLQQARAVASAAADRRRNRALALCCSAYWIAEKMAGRRIYPSTPCRCERCKGRRQWPNNAYVNSRGLSFDCQVERQEVDPELAEMLDELRGGSASVIDERKMLSRARQGKQYTGEKP